MQTSDLNVNNSKSDHANAIFRQFQDAVFSREHTYVVVNRSQFNPQTILFSLGSWRKYIF